LSLPFRSRDSGTPLYLEVPLPAEGWRMPRERVHPSEAHADGSLDYYAPLSYECPPMDTCQQKTSPARSFALCA